MSLTTEKFIENAIHVHGNRYEYSRVIYTGTRNKVKIICEEHGEFQVTPNDHVSKHSGCPVCSGKKKGNTEQFIEKSTLIHSDKYDYSLVEYVNLDTKVTIICKDHGEFDQTPRSHVINKAGCPICGKSSSIHHRTKTTELFILQSQAVHGSNYDYSLVKYKGTKTKVDIICNTHGIFKQSPCNHISLKQGCAKCYNERRTGGPGGYSSTMFENFPEMKDIEACLYVIQVTDGNKNFIKVGITKYSVQERYMNKELRIADWTEIISIKLSLYDAFLLEQKILTHMKTQQYWPTRRFGGFTECIKCSDSNINTIMNLIQENTNVK